MSWAAWYMPATIPGHEDSSKANFETEEDAWSYARGHFCDDCRREEDEGEDSACACEWMVEEISDYEGFEEI